MNNMAINAYTDYIDFAKTQFQYSSLAQSVEHAAVNRVVVGSSPTGGAIWPVGQAVKTPPFHGGIGGSIPPRVTRKKHFLRSAFFNEINPFGICEIHLAVNEIAKAMKCTAVHGGFILFHFILSNSEIFHYNPLAFEQSGYIALSKKLLKNS